MASVNCDSGFWAIFHLLHISLTTNCERLSRELLSVGDDEARLIAVEENFKKTNSKRSNLWWPYDLPYCKHGVVLCEVNWWRFVTLLLACIVLLAGVCCLSSSSACCQQAGRPPGAWAVGRPTLYGGPVRLRPVRATLNKIESVGLRKAYW